MQVWVGTRRNICESAPKMPPMERLSIVFHYHHMPNYSPRWLDKYGSTCPIKCRDPATGKVNKYDTIRSNVICTACTFCSSTEFEVSIFSNTFLYVIVYANLIIFMDYISGSWL